MCIPTLQHFLVCLVRRLPPFSPASAQGFDACVCSPCCLIVSAIPASHGFETETRTTIIPHINIPGSLRHAGNRHLQCSLGILPKCSKTNWRLWRRRRPRYLDKPNTDNMGAYKCAQSPLLHDGLVSRYRSILKLSLMFMYLNCSLYFKS